MRTTVEAWEPKKDSLGSMDGAVSILPDQSDDHTPEDGAWTSATTVGPERDNHVEPSAIPSEGLSLFGLWLF